MSRSSWKYIYHTDYDLEVFYSSIDNSFNLPSNNRRSLTINRLNYTQNHYVYQGKYNVYFDTSIYCLNYKLGMFTKTRKPFFFRSKKKKKKLNLYNKI